VKASVKASQRGGDRNQLTKLRGDRKGTEGICRKGEGAQHHLSGQTRLGVSVVGMRTDPPNYLEKREGEKKSRGSQIDGGKT